MIELFFGLLALLPLIIDTGAARPYEPPKIELFQIAVAVFAAAVLMMRRNIKIVNLDLAVIGAFTISALASAFGLLPWLSFFGSVERRMGLIFILALLLMYLLVRTLATSESWKLFWGLLLTVGVGVAGYGIAQWLGFDLAPLKQAFPVYGTHGAERAFSTLGHPNFLGAYLAMLLPLVFLLKKRYAWPVGLILSLAIVVTYSRAAWLALAAGILVTWTLLERDRWRRAVPIMITSVVCAAVLIFSARPLLLASESSFLFRLGTLTEWHEGSIRVRLNEWRFGLGKIMERPILGYGPETYQLISEKRVKDFREAARGATGPDPTVADRLHNLWLDTLWSFGFLGLAALLIVLILAARGLRDWLRASKDRTEAAAVAGALAAWLVANQAGFDSSVTAIFFTLLLARVAQET